MQAGKVLQIIWLHFLEVGVLSRRRMTRVCPPFDSSVGLDRGTTRTG